MGKEKSSKKVIGKKLMPQVLKILEAQGGQSLLQARERLVAIKLENANARKGLEMYAENWIDTIHPSILSLSAEAVSESVSSVSDLQVMFLLMTAAMDIHDDVLDKSLSKNGKETLYGKFGEDLAILVGDALLMESLMMLPSFRDTMNSESFSRLLYAVKSTLLQVGNAHLIELQLKKKADVTPQDILDLIEKKAAIFEGLAEIGAIAGKGSTDQTNVLKATAKTFGYLVMLREEFIDMFEPDELYSRLKNEYPPLPILCAIEDPSVKKYMTSMESGEITEDSTQELINLVYKNRNVIELKQALRKKAKQTIGLLKKQNLSEKSVTSLTLLMETTLEDI
jgi:geranylgeranyl diphosphate synthase type II